MAEKENSREERIYSESEVRTIGRAVLDMSVEVHSLRDFYRFDSGTTHTPNSVRDDLETMIGSMKEHPEIFQDYIEKYIEARDNLDDVVSHFLVGYLERTLFSDRIELWPSSLDPTLREIGDKVNNMPSPSQSDDDLPF